MLGATFARRHCAKATGEKAYTRLFWRVIGGYAVRLLVNSLNAVVRIAPKLCRDDFPSAGSFHD
jgi:hypothetical protein